MRTSGYDAGKNKNVQVKVITDDYTFDEYTDGGYAFSNKGATSAIEMMIPAAKPGRKFTAYVDTACPFRLQPQSGEYIALPSTGAYGTADKYISADAAGEQVTLICRETGKWAAKDYTGTWTKES
jgi:hypothetical protein